MGSGTVHAHPPLTKEFHTILCLTAQIAQHERERGREGSSGVVEDSKILWFTAGEGGRSDAAAFK